MFQTIEVSCTTICKNPIFYVYGFNIGLLMKQLMKTFYYFISTILPVYKPDIVDQMIKLFIENACHSFQCHMFPRRTLKMVKGQGQGAAVQGRQAVGALPTPCSWEHLFYLGEGGRVAATERPNHKTIRPSSLHSSRENLCI